MCLIRVRVCLNARLGVSQLIMLRARNSLGENITRGGDAQLWYPPGSPRTLTHGRCISVCTRVF